MFVSDKMIWLEQLILEHPESNRQRIGHDVRNFNIWVDQTRVIRTQLPGYARL